MTPVKRFTKKVSLAMITVMIAVMMFAGTALAQAPQPTAVPPSGSNPQTLAPTDIPPDYSLLGVLIFFGVLCVWLIAANFLIRNRVFSDQIDQPSSTTQPDAPQVKLSRGNGIR